MLDWKDEKDAMCIITNSNTEILAKYLSSSPGSKYFSKGASHPNATGSITKPRSLWEATTAFASWLAYRADHISSLKESFKVSRN